MSVFDEPVRAKKTIIALLILFIFFFLVSLGVGYFAWDKYSDVKILKSEKDNLSKQLDSATGDLQEQIKELEEEKSTLEEENSTLKEENAAYEERITQVDAYNAFFEYMTNVIAVHSGFSGWTEEEYQHAKGLAEKTGNSSFVSDVDWAWHNTSIDPVTRIVKVYRDIIAGIKG